MRILTVTHYQPPHHGGIETVADALVTRYRRAGHECVWLSSDLPRTPAALGNVRVHAWNVLEDRLGVPYPLWSPRALGIVRHWVEWSDVVHMHDCLYLGSVLSTVHAQRLRKPVLMTQHVGPVPYRSAVLRAVQSIAYASLGRALHSQVDQVVFISHVVAAWFGAQVSYKRLPQVIANGVDTSLFHYGDAATRTAARQRLDLPTDRQVMLFAGRFVFKKGTAVIEQLARLRPGWLFVLLGDGPIDPCQWHLANVIVRPFQPQTVLRDYYWASDALLLPSTGEGFPLVVLEAMACGTPALIPEATFAAWNEGREFFITCEPNAVALASAFEANAHVFNREFRRALSDYARAQWDWDAVVGRYLALLEQLQQTPAQS